MDNEVGLVVIARNEGPRLVQCLDSVRSINPEQVVYVDSGSTDGSLKEAAQRRIPTLPLDVNRPFTAARARNEGFAKISDLNPRIRFVQFVDGDCELAEGWLDAARRFLMERPDVAVVCGRRRERYPMASVYNRLCDVEWDTPVGEALACGGDAMVRVESFRAAGGFNERLFAGEEPELCHRLRTANWRVWRLGHDMTLHDAAMTRFGQWWRRAVRSGYGYAAVMRLTLCSPEVLYRREVQRAIFSGFVFPIAILCISLLHPIGLVGLLLYPLQIARIALARGATEPLSWSYGLYMTLAKFAEAQGVLKFFWTKMRGKAAVSLEYKQGSRP